MEPLLINHKSFDYNIGGSKCILFGDLNNKIHPLSNQNVFTNVKTCFPKYKNLNTFSPLIFTCEDLLIKKNNPYYYYTSNNAATYERNHHVIFKLINYNYAYITSPKVNVLIEEECVSFLNCFLDSNSGHALSHILYCLNYYLQRNLKLKIILYKKTYASIKSIINLHIEDNKIIFIDSNQTYHFTKLHIPEEHAFNITNFRPLIDNIIDKVINCHLESISKYKGKNIFMVKTKSNSMRPEDGFEFEPSHRFFHYIDPHQTSIYDIILYLHFCKSVTTSFGSIYYTNMIFCNKDAKIIYTYYNLANSIPYYYRGNNDEFTVIDQNLGKNEKIENFSKHKSKFKLIEILKDTSLNSYIDTIMLHIIQS